MFGLSVFSSAAKPHYGALFDVSSDSVGIALIKSESGTSVPRVIFAHRVHMRLRTGSPEATERLKQMRETLFSASLVFSKDGLQALTDDDRRARISKIFLIASAPWAYTLSREVSYEDAQDFQITDDLINDLSLTAEKGLDAPSDDEAIFVTDGFTVVENTTVDIRVNGYSVSDPHCLKGKSLSLSHITGFMHRDIIESINDVRDKIFTETAIDTHTGMLVTYCVLRDFFKETKDLVIVSVTGESTEIGIVEHGTLVETHSIHYGAHTLVRDVVAKTNLSPEHVLSMLRGYAELTLNETARNAIETHVNLYAMKLSELFSTIINRRAIPKTVVVLTEPGIENFVRAEVLKKLENITSEHFTMLHVDNKLFKHPDSHSGTDVRLAIAARFFHKIHCGEEEPKD